MKIKVNIEITKDGKKPETCNIELTMSEGFSKLFPGDQLVNEVQDYASMKMEQQRQRRFQEEYGFQPIPNIVNPEN